MGHRVSESTIILTTMVPSFSISMGTTLKPCATTRSNRPNMAFERGRQKRRALNFTLGAGQVFSNIGRNLGMVVYCHTQVANDY